MFVNDEINGNLWNLRFRWSNKSFETLIDRRISIVRTRCRQFSRSNGDTKTPKILSNWSMVFRKSFRWKCSIYAKYHSKIRRKFLCNGSMSSSFTNLREIVSVTNESSRRTFFFFFDVIFSFRFQNVTFPTLKFLPMICKLHHEQNRWNQTICSQAIVYFLHLIYAFWPHFEVKTTFFFFNECFFFFFSLDLLSSNVERVDQLFDWMSNIRRTSSSTRNSMWKLFVVSLRVNREKKREKKTKMKKLNF